MAARPRHEPRSVQKAIAYQHLANRAISNTSLMRAGLIDIL